MSETAIKVENLSKIYKLYDKPIDRMKESLHPLRKTYHKDFYALRDVSFEIKKGETVGIIGKNGSGKSTLLKILTGVLTPSGGKVQVNGKVSALLELGAGFNPDFSGLENVYFNGSIMGYTREQMEAKIDDILSFADIGDFINQPVKTYSSGMFVRLAFSVATVVDPEILIVDEALSVGDMFFQAKCMTRMKRMIEDDGTTLLFVSHDTGSVKALCKKGVLLQSGTMIYNGESSVAVEKYFNMKVESDQKVVTRNKNQGTGACLIGSKKEQSNSEFSAFFEPNSEFLKISRFERIQNGKAEFKNVILLDEDDIPVKEVVFGQKVKLRMAIEIHEDIHLLAYGYHIRDRNGIDLIYSDCYIQESCALKNLKADDRYFIDWLFEIRLSAGQFNIVSVLSIPVEIEVGKVDFCDFIPIANQFTVLPNNPSPIYGLVSWENEVQIHKIENKAL